MATEEKKPETEAAEAQPPSSSATQSKVRPRGPRERPGHGGCGSAWKCYFKCISLFSLPTETVHFTQTAFPASAFMGVLGMPHLSPGEGLCQPLVLIVRVSMGPGRVSC